MFHPIKNPKHYAGNGKISCKDALRSMMSRTYMQPEKAYWWGIAFKYLWRWPLKDGRKDLEKCKQCIDYLLELPDDMYPTIEVTYDERDHLMDKLANLDGKNMNVPSDGMVDAMKLSKDELEAVINEG